MRKTDKKIANQLREGLTAVCEHALAAYPGFAWITHVVDYALFPKSLRIICVFNTEQQLTSFTQSGHKAALLVVIQRTLGQYGVKLNDMTQQVVFDTETACEHQDNGNWALRLSDANRRAKTARLTPHGLN